MDPRVIPIFLIFLAYLLVCGLIGWVAFKKGFTTSEDYFLGGRSWGTFALFATLFASLYSISTFIGTTGFAYTHGVGGWVYPAHELLLGFVMISFAVPMYRVSKAYRYVTPGDMLAHRYDDKWLATITGLMYIVFIVPYCSLQLIGMSRTLQGVSGGLVPYWVGVVFFGGFVVLYTVIGGMRAVVWTDVVQFIMMFGLIYVILLIIGSRFGGLSNLWTKVAEVKPTLLYFPGGAGYFTKITWITWWGSLVVGCMGFPTVWQRVYMAKSVKVVYMMAILTPLAIFLINIPPVVTGFAGHILLKEPLQIADTVMPVLLTQFLGVAWATILLSGAIAAAMSTIDSFILTASSNITRDVYEKVAKQPSQRKSIFVATIASLVIGGSSLILAFYPPPLMSLIVPFAMQGYTIVLIVAWIGMYWPRANRYGAYAALIIGFLVTIFTRKVVPNPLGIDTGLWSLVATIGAMILFSYFGPPTTERVLKEYSDTLGWEKKFGAFDTIISSFRKRSDSESASSRHLS